MKEALYSILFTLLILFTWSTVCYWYFRLSNAETELRMRTFLKNHYKFYTGRTYRDEAKPLTKKAIWMGSLWGWVFVPFAFSGLYRGDWYSPHILISIGLLFFSGLYFSFGWYGIRCLRLLQENENKHE